MDQDFNEIEVVAGSEYVMIYAIFFAVLVLAVIYIVKSFLHICRPNEVLVFSGGRNQSVAGAIKGYRVVFGGRSWCKPLVEEVHRLDMRTLPIELIVSQAYSSDGIPLSVRAIANVKISSDPKYIGNAIERFLGKKQTELERVARETLEGALRGVLAKLTPVHVNEDRLRFAESLRQEVADDFTKLGLHLDILKIQNVSDDREYLESLGRKKIAEVIKRAEIAESDAGKEAAQVVSERKAEGEIARQNADRIILQKQNQSKEREADLKKNVEMAERRAQAEAQKVRYEAELELQAVRAELEKLRLVAEIELPAEAGRRAKELEAKAKAAPIAEDGKALAAALVLVAQAWSEAGENAKDIAVIQQLESIMKLVVDSLSQLDVGEVNIIDPGDGSAVGNYVSGFPKAITAIFYELKNLTGVDVIGTLAAKHGSDVLSIQKEA